MKSIYIVLVLLVFTGEVAFSQNKETCESSEVSYEDLNIISKCLAQTSTSNKAKIVREIAPRRTTFKSRFFKKRKRASVIKDCETTKKQTVKTLDYSPKMMNQLIQDVAAINTNNDDTINNFTTVDVIPLFKNCETSFKEEQLSCFNSEMREFLNSNIRYPKKAKNAGVTGRVAVKFIIDNKGKVNNIQITGPKGNGKILNNEVTRLVTTLPKFIPAKKEGKATAVEYEFTVNFSL